MELPDSLSGVTESASDRAAEARESLSAGAADASVAAAETAAAAKAAATTARNRAADEVPARLPEEAPDPATLAATARSYSIPTDRLLTDPAELGPAARAFGVRALGLVQTVDIEETYRFGKRGFEYGGTYGRYVPFGAALPYVGLLAGLGAGVLDSTDVVSAETLLGLTEYAPAAVQRLLEAGAAERADAGASALTDGVDALDGATETVDQQTASDLTEMDYDEFADR
ncbi:hypothetical protein ACFPYI_03740 [Halomarina salina]|uniref:Uncharacterized protein n=1 Tax=Halomarina salina TaxID=1872699 RepID=A0ABD5RJA2_9EURY|nr:hypothetical protein [Halomarina salina]